MSYYCIANPQTIVSLHTTGKIPENQPQKIIPLYRTVEECFRNSILLPSATFVVEVNPLPCHAQLVQIEGREWFEVELIDPKTFIRVYTVSQHAQNLALKILNDQTSLPFEVHPEYAELSQKRKSSYSFQPLPPPPLRKGIRLIKQGDLLGSRMQTLVNTVNCVGVMGKGIALSFKKSYPEMFTDYKRRCDKKEVKLGVPYIYSISAEKKIVNFPTKNHWKTPSKLCDIEEGLKQLASSIRIWKITSLALPALGCGNGGLKWEDVYPLIQRHLFSLEIPIELYIPFESKISSHQEK